MSDIEIGRIISISKHKTTGGAWISTGFKKYRSKKAKWFLYFTDSEGIFHSKRISTPQAIYYKIVKRLKLKK